MRSSTEHRTALSLLIVAFLGLKAVELAGRVEQWPLTHAPMFAAYRPAGVAPWRVVLEARFGQSEHVLAPRDFGLTRDEMLRRLAGGADAVVRGCSSLRRVLEAAAPARPVTDMRARVWRIPRPGVPASPGPAEVILPCP